MMSGSSLAEPGVTTLRLPDSLSSSDRDQHARDVDVEVGFVCKKCRAAFVAESSLLQHQRQCYTPQNQQRGAFRLVQPVVECKLCSERFRTMQEYRKHQESHQQPPPAESPLSHEMEDVVNQITLLAARAAQEAEPRRFLGPEPLTSAGH